MEDRTARWPGVSQPLPGKGTFRSEELPWVSVYEGVKEIMLLAARSVVRNMTLASALAPLVLLCEFRLQCARALDAFNFSLNG